MSKKPENINVFVPALALQHFCNPADATRNERIKLAVMRFYLNKDFYNPAYQRPAPYVFLEKIYLKTDPLGYAVQAVIQEGV